MKTQFSLLNYILQWLGSADFFKCKKSMKMLFTIENRPSSRLDRDTLSKLDLSQVKKPFDGAFHLATFPSLSLMPRNNFAIF